MSDKPILFSAPMVRALLAGTKTQTRRFLDLACDEPPALVEDGVITAFDAKDRPYRWPHTKAVGDRLYVREHWCTDAMFDDIAPRELELGTPVQYGSDGDPKLYAGGIYPGRFRQGMHMPRWASRITLTVTDVRVQRLRDITEEDAAAEGVKPWPTEFFDAGFIQVESAKVPCRTLYADLWDKINGPGSWGRNPWVAAYTFTVERANIDQARAA